MIDRLGRANALGFVAVKLGRSAWDRGCCGSGATTRPRCRDLRRVLAYYLVLLYHVQYAATLVRSLCRKFLTWPAARRYTSAGRAHPRRAGLHRRFHGGFMRPFESQAYAAFRIVAGCCSSGTAARSCFGFPEAMPAGATRVHRLHRWRRSSSSAACS
jgi:hypothetical protein